MIEIRHIDGHVLYTAENATNIRTAFLEAVRAGSDLRRSDLRGSDLSGSDLSYSNLHGSNLSGSDLRCSDLRYSNLRCSNLSGSDLSGSDLSYSNLSYSEGVVKQLTSPLYMLLDQPGKIRAYKLVDQGLKSPIQSTGQLTYTVGATVECADADTDEYQDCAAGINVATLDWCLREWRKGRRILLVEFTAKDIAAIPVGTDGKFRVSKCRVVKEIDLTGLVPQAQA